MRQRGVDREEKVLAIKAMETFHWENGLDSVDVHFPSMRMHFESYAYQLWFDVRRKADGSWEQRSTRDMQAYEVKCLTELRKKVAQIEQLPDDQREVASAQLIHDPNHRLGCYSLAEIDEALARERSNEWRPLTLEDLAPQIEFHYNKLLQSAR